jgi:hypothetical protein
MRMHVERQLAEIAAAESMSADQPAGGATGNQGGAEPYPQG